MEIRMYIELVELQELTELDRLWLSWTENKLIDGLKSTILLLNLCQREHLKSLCQPQLTSNK